MCRRPGSFEVPDKDVFVRRRLPRYFRHSRFASFQRQLNLYGFKKSDEGELRFEHPDFLRDAPQRVTKVLRAPPQPPKPRPKKKNVVRKPPSSDDDYSDGDKTPSPKRSRCDVSALFGRDKQRRPRRSSR